MRAFVGFAGFGGVDIALRKAGFKVIGVEIDPAIAEINRYNGGHCLTADILSLDAADFIGYYLMHFSPPCPSFSIANHSSGETELDLALAHQIARFIVVSQPEYFTLENVWLYRKSESWGIILEALRGMGYGVNWWNLNAADYGVPQSRKRMIVIARHDGVKPVKPWPTHSKAGDMFTQPWRGWYEAIEDLIPDLPETQFAPWQSERMPEKLKTFLLMTCNTNRNGIDNVSGRGVLDVDQSANTVVGGSWSTPKALLVSNNSEHLGLFDSNAPSSTITTHSYGRLRAFIINSQNTTRPLTVRSADEPMMTVNANAAEHRSLQKAFIVSDQNGSICADGNRKITILQQDQPVFTITSGANHQIRAGLGHGRVVSMTPRCLARFQDFPDWFVLPGEGGLTDPPILAGSRLSARELACRGIGNAVPVGLYNAVLKSFLTKEK
jgi:DNA-cytosine methyltransferase